MDCGSAVAPVRILVHSYTSAGQVPGNKDASGSTKCTYMSSSQVDRKDRRRDRILRSHLKILTARLALNDAAAATGHANSSVAHDSNAEELAELQQELQILKAQKDIYADADADLCTKGNSCLLSTSILAQAGTQHQRRSSATSPLITLVYAGWVRMFRRKAIVSGNHDKPGSESPRNGVLLGTIS